METGLADSLTNQLVRELTGIDHIPHSKYGKKAIEVNIKCSLNDIYAKIEKLQLDEVISKYQAEIEHLKDQVESLNGEIDNLNDLLDD